MNKHDVLQAIRELHARGELSRSDVLHALEGKHASHGGRGFKITDVLYFLGGIIVLSGITVFIGQHWEELNSLTRVLVTFGSGVATYAVGITFLQRTEYRFLSGTFFFLSALLIPTGIAVVLREWGNSPDVPLAEVIISVLSLFTYGTSYAFFKKNYFLTFSIIFATWFFFALTNWMTVDNPVFNAESFMEYRVLCIALSYMLLGYSFQKGALSSFAGPLYTIGALAFLLSSFALGGFDRDVFTVWEFIFPALCFGFIFLSTVVRSNGFLFSGALLLMIDIFKITSDYFTDSFGWPLSLILCGIALIVIGFVTLRVQRNYIRS